MGADNIASDALLLLLETVNKQASQIKRLESIVSSDNLAYDTSAQRHGSDRTSKQLQQLQSSIQGLEQQHAASCSSTKDLADQLHKMEQRMQQLEAQGQALQQHSQLLQQQLGSPAHTKAAGNAQHRNPNGTFMSIMSGTAGGSSTAEEPAAGSAQGPHAGLPGGRTMAARLSRLEQQVETLAAVTADSEEKLQSASSAVQSLDDDVAKQLHNMRADVKQAITVASSSLRADVEAAATARQQQDAAQLKEQLTGLTAEIDTLAATSQRTLMANLTADMERRAAAAHEATDTRINALRSQLDRLEEEKADITLVTQYTGQVADVFEQLATTVADSTQASIAQLVTQQQELRTLLNGLSASKADGSTLLQHQQHCQQQLLELQRGLAGAQAAASEAAVAAAVAKAALEPVDSLRLQLAETQGAVVALQATAAGLEAGMTSGTSAQQQQAQQLQQLAGNLHMLQQQLLALTNHVDPAAAAQLAAAAAGDESALNFQPLGPLASGCGSLLSNAGAESLSGGTGGVWDEAWATGSYLQGCSTTGGQAAASAVTGAGAAAAGASGSEAATSAGEAPGQLPAASTAGCEAGCVLNIGAASVGSSNGGQATPGARTAAAGRGFADRMGAVLRHLPVAVRLLRLETAVRDLHNALVQKAPAGDVLGLQQQLEVVSERLISGLTQLKGVSSSGMRRLEEQATTLADAVAAVVDSLEERPTHVQVQEAASAATRAAAASMQQQVGQVTAELEAVKARLRGAGQDLQQLKDWQAEASKQVGALQGAEQAVRQLGQQLQQQVAADLGRQQGEVQQLLSQHSAEVARDTIKQFRADQEAQGSAEAAARALSLESKLKVVVAELDRMQEQAALTARLQDKHTDMMTALEAALAAQSSKYSTVSQQLRMEVKEALAKTHKAHSAKAAALEASLKQQGDVLAQLAASVAELPSKDGLLEAALQSAKATVQDMLAQHRRQEESRWEVWLAEFARALEQRPTAQQLQKQLRAAQLASESNAQEAAVQRMQCITAALESGVRQQLRVFQQQLLQLRDRTQTLEQGTGISEGYTDAYDAPAGRPGSPVPPPHAQRETARPARPRQSQGRGSGRALAAEGSGCDAAAHRAPDVTAGDASPSFAAAVAPARAETDGAEGPTVNVAAIVAAFEGSPAPANARSAAMQAAAVLPGAASPAAFACAPPADAQSVWAAPDSPAVPRWRELPLASSALAEATRAAAAAAMEPIAPRADSSVAARVEGNSSSSEASVGRASIYGSSSCCEADSNPPCTALQLRLPCADSAAAGGAGEQPSASVVQSCGSARGGDWEPASPPSMRSPSPKHLLQGHAPTGSCATSTLHASAAAATPAAAHSSSTPHRAAGQASAVQASPALRQQQQLQQQASEANTDCTSELQQLLDLQQQVQQCLVESGCVTVGRRIKTPNSKQHKKERSHKRTHNPTPKDGGVASALGEGAAADPHLAAAAAAATKAAAVAVVAAAAAAGGPECETQTGMQGAPGDLTVDAAIAAAAAALGGRPRQAATASAGSAAPPVPAAAAAAGHQQQQGGQAAAPTPPTTLALPRPSRSQEIRGLLTLQQQLAQCLKDHGCFLEQHRQEQQQQPEPFMAAAGGSSIAGLQQQQAADAPPQQQQQQQQQQAQGQQYPMQEVELEQLLVLQAQMQQAVRHQGH